MALHMNQTLSFDRHLRHAFAPLSGRLEIGIKALDSVIEMLRLRIEAEAAFASSLQRIISNEKLFSHLSPLESLRKDGLDAIQADMKNEYSQRIEFLNSLNEDVYQPCVAMRELYASKNRLFANDTKNNIKALRSQQNQFYKIKGKYEKVCKEASSARTALLNAKLDNKISSQQILKLGSKVNSTLKTQQTWKEKYDQQQVIWNRQQIKFDDEMTSILQGMQANEYNRMKTTKDSLNKWAVFITNLSANRNYDVKNLAESMSLIDIEKDLQIFIRHTLQQHPSKMSTNGQIPPHHTLHYGKQHQNAISNLNKVSSQKDQTAVNLNQRGNHHRSESSIHSLQLSNIGNGGGHKRQTSASMSFSSYNPSYYNSHNRKGSASYSLSEQHNVRQELSKRQIRQQSSPNSIGSFFKQKFQKQRSYNSHRSDTNDQREHSNTISSFHDSEVYEPIDEEHAHSPKGVTLSPRVSPRKGTSTSPKIVNMSDHDPELPSLGNGNMANGAKHSISMEMEHPIQPNSAQHRQPMMRKKKKLKKPSAKTKKRSFKKNRSTINHNRNNSINNNNHRKNSHTPPPIQHPSQSHPQLHHHQQHPQYHQNQNTSSYIENNHNTEQIQPQTQPSPISATATPTTKTVSISARTATPRFKVNMKQTPQIIVIRKKSKSPSRPKETLKESIDDDNECGPVPPQIDSTPELSADSMSIPEKIKKPSPVHDSDSDEIDPLD